MKLRGSILGVLFCIMFIAFLIGLNHQPVKYCRSYGAGDCVVVIYSLNSQQPQFPETVPTSVDLENIVRIPGVHEVSMSKRETTGEYSWYDVTRRGVGEIRWVHRGTKYASKLSPSC